MSLVLFTDFVADPVVRYDIGEYFLYFVGVCFAINLLFFVVSIVKNICISCKRRSAKKKAIKEFKDNLALKQEEKEKKAQ